VSGWAEPAESSTLRGGVGIWPETLHGLDRQFIIMITEMTAQKAMDRLEKEGFDALTQEEATVATVWLFLAGVSNNGFAHYFASKRGDLAFNAPAALRTIGATRHAELAAEANAVFGGAGPSRDLTLRRDAVKALPGAAQQALAALEKRYFDCDEDVDAVLDDYVSKQTK